MASPCWGTSRRLADVLFSAAYEFEFFQAVRLLAQAHRERAKADDAASPDSEVVRFRVKNSLAFPASQVASIEQDGDGPPTMKVSFIGLTGPKGVLPVAYTEIAMSQRHTGDDAFAAFLDIFNHRLIALFYAAWEKHHFTVGYEKAMWAQEADAVTASLFDLIGLGTDGLQDRLGIPARALLPHAGLLAQRPHSCDAVRAVLESYFGVPTDIEQFQGKWHALETYEMCVLGSGDEATQLGGGAVAGDAVWSRQATVRIVFGPLELQAFRALLPDGKQFEQATSLVRFLLGEGLEFEIQPRLRAEHVPSCRLGDDSVEGARLGWCTWIDADNFDHDADDALFAEFEQITVEAYR
jgi:type VI secretion system protein ImpH